MEEIRLNDIADDLLILNKITIDRLFQLENCADCIALYIFYYKTAKWQKTNTIKANDLYVKKCLKWGYDKIKNTKNSLKEQGLINIVQRRKDGKICGWYVEVGYLVSQKKTADVSIKIEDGNNTYNQQLLKPTSGDQNINTLKEYIKYLENKIEILEKNKKNTTSKKSYGEYQRVKLTDKEYQKLCDDFNKDFIDNQIKLLDEYVESNNNKNKYTNFNLVIRKSIRENWFKTNSNNSNNSNTGEVKLVKLEGGAFKLQV